MSGIRSVIALAATACAFAAGTGRAEATEAAAGRYIPGVTAQPGAGIVPPVPGLYWGVSNIFYQGDASAQIPVGNNLLFNLEGTIWTTAIAGVYVPKLELGNNWTYAVSMVLPFGYMESTAGIGPFSTSEDVTGLGDIQVTPLLFGWHNSAANTFVSAGLTVTAPTGRYDPGAIAFIGLNYWSFTPALGFTHIDTKRGIDYSAKLGIDFNTENPDTDYHSGAVAHLDLAVTKSITERFSVGVIGGLLYQVEDDDSPLADALNGFRGRSITVGPLIKYKAKFDETEIDFALSWAPEIHVENRLKGNSVFLNVSGKF